MVYLKKIIKIPSKIFNFLENNLFDFIFYINGNLKKLDKGQNLNFIDLGFDRFVGQKKLANLITLYPEMKSSMSSEHQVLFAALAAKKNYKLKNILEIGTHDATNVLLMSKLFPKSKIVTIDLEDSNNEFSNSYNRDKKDLLNKFIKNRNNILAKCNNVNFVQKNSLNLIFENKKFDLIWIDGAHGYPVLPIDISNSIRLIERGGLIMCDDIYISKRINPDNMYKSYAGFETLKSLENSGLIKFSLIYKRINFNDNSVPKNKKYVAIVKIKDLKHDHDI